MDSLKGNLAAMHEKVDGNKRKLNRNEANVKRCCKVELTQEKLYTNQEINIRHYGKAVKVTNQNCVL
jgi:hypothetical protein